MDQSLLLQNHQVPLNHLLQDSLFFPKFLLNSKLLKDVNKDNNNKEKIITIIEHDQIQTDIRSTAIELLLSIDSVASNQLYELGLKLLKNDSMLFGCVRLFESSGMDFGFEEIKKIMEDTKDIQLRALCEDIIEKSEEINS